MPSSTSRATTRRQDRCSATPSSGRTELPSEAGSLPPPFILFRRTAMDYIPLHYALFLSATFAAALVAGVSGFAFGLIAAAVWLHLLTPLQTATLIIAFGLIVQ